MAGPCERIAPPTGHMVTQKVRQTRRKTNVPIPADGWTPAALWGDPSQKWSPKSALSDVDEKAQRRRMGLRKRNESTHTHTADRDHEVGPDIFIYLCFSCWRKYCKNPLLYLRDGVHGVFVVGGGVWVDGSSGLSAALWQSRSFHACQNFSSTSTDLFVAPRDRRRERRWCLWVGPWSPLQRLWVSLPDFLCSFTPQPINVIAFAFLSLSLFVCMCMCVFIFIFKVILEYWEFVSLPVMGGGSVCLARLGNTSVQNCVILPAAPINPNKADQVSKSDALMFFFPPKHKFAKQDAIPPHVTPPWHWTTAPPQPWPGIALCPIIHIISLSFGADHRQGSRVERSNESFFVNLH